MGITGWNAVATSWNAIGKLKTYSMMIPHTHNLQLLAPAEGGGMKCGTDCLHPCGERNSVGLCSWQTAQHFPVKRHRRCLAAETATVVKSLSQMKLVHYNLMAIFMHPKVTCPKIQPPPTEHMLYILLTRPLRAKQENFIPISDKDFVFYRI